MVNLLPKVLLKFVLALVWTDLIEHMKNHKNTVKSITYDVATFAFCYP